MAMADGGFSAARLVRMRGVMAGHVGPGRMPGLVTLVERHGDVHVEALGTLGFEDPRPMRRDTIFRIASVTKPITAVAALILVEECRLRLDDPVDELLPELADRRVLVDPNGPLDATVPAHRPITLRDLLTFRLGTGYATGAAPTSPFAVAMAERIGFGPPRPAATPPPDEWMARLGTLPLLHQPGERWLYHIGAEVLGVLIARAAGQPLEAFLRARIFDPLGMADTAFHVPPAAIDRLATAYWTDPESAALGVFDPAAGGEWSMAPAFPSGGGGLVSTVDDLAAFGRMLLDGGRVPGGGRILARPSVEAMTTDQLTPGQKARSGLVEGYFEHHGWGFGVGVATMRIDPAEPVGSFGWDGGLGTSWRCDPREDMVSILLTQQAWSSPVPPAVCRDFATAAYQAIDD
jgi:CubicO group peptidase (beta-lactamase class C family)